MKFLLSFALFFTWVFTQAQENLSYQVPPNEIMGLVDVTVPPRVLMTNNGSHAILLYRNAFETIEEMSEPELRLAGLRINPKTNISSRTRFYNDVKILDIETGVTKKIIGLPERGRFSKFLYSPDETKMAFTHTHEKGVELWYIDIEKYIAKQLTKASVNANINTTMLWAPDNQSLLVKLLPNNKKEIINAEASVPTGPTISISYGKKAPNRTYQDLLKNPIDEKNFEQLILSEISKVDLAGNIFPILPTAMYTSFSFSPNGAYLLVTKLERPFSYLVPYYRFPSKTNLFTSHGDFVKNIVSVPLIEDMPKGRMAVRTGKRRIQWRNDQAATLVWVEALDEGDPAKEVDHRDAVYVQAAPFDQAGNLVLKTINRFQSIQWGAKNLAFATDRWWNNRNTKTYVFNPINPTEFSILSDRNYQDRYSDPGELATEKNEYGKDIVTVLDGAVFLLGDGYSDEGVRPFVDKLHVKTGKKERLWQADGKRTLEEIVSAVDIRKGLIISRLQSIKDYPNYYMRNIYSKKRPQQVTYIENPFQSLEGVQKEVIRYTREDGMPLSGTLYLPPDYQKGSGKKLPMLLWAYPREYKDKNSASQVISSPHQFISPSYGSPIFWVMRGYAVLDRAAFPILGEGETEPNDSFVEQLVANAKAAIDAVDEMGYIDRTRVGVGGHSYGAFMTANLLSHSNLFAAGIARSGAYNRTLTPFGFQSEQRSYWEAPEIYYSMSPFMHADKVRTPILLIHGEADNNSGTYPMQSIRYFNALKGMGTNARLVMMPKESHGYRAKESILHMLWEQDQWLEKYVKNKTKEKYYKP